MLTGIALKVVSALCFTLMAALIRSLGTDIPVGQTVFARSAFALIPILIWYAMQGQLRDIRTARPAGHCLRSGVGVIAMYCMFAALSRLTLPDATMIHYASPVITVVLAAIVLREPMRLPRVVAVCVGLAGVAVMLWPHLADGSLMRAFASGETNMASQGALFAFGGAFFTACAMIQIRRLVHTETTASIVFWFTVLSSLIALLTLPFGWAVPDLKASLTLVAIGFFGGIGQILLTSAYRNTEASVIAPFEYTTLIWSLSIGWLAFNDLPDEFALIGGIIVIGSGFIVIYDERRRGIERKKVRQAKTLD